jgi:transposase
LLAEAPEPGMLTRREISVLIRVTQASGTAERNSKDGKTLYMSALFGTRHNPVIKEFYTQLVAADSKKVELTTRIRKLLTILNTML